MIEVNYVFSRHGDLKQVKVSTVQPTQIGWKYRVDDTEYFTEINVFRISHDFIGNKAKLANLDEREMKLMDWVDLGAGR